MTDGPYELPSGWRWARLGEVVQREAVAIQPSKNPDRLFNYLGLEQLASGQWEEPEENQVFGLEVRSTCFAFQPGYVLYAKLRPYLNKVVVCSRKGIGSTEFVPLLPQPSVLTPEFLAAYLRSPWFVNYASHSVTGSRMPRVSAEAIGKVPIPLPPLAEQRRIVASVEALMERVREAKHLREESRKDADTLFHSALEHVLADVYANSPQTFLLGDFATAFNGRASGSGDSTVRVFKTKHVYPFDLKQTDPSYMIPAQATKCPSDRFLRSGDVLVCNIARGTLGRVCHVDSAEDNWTVDTQIMILRTEAKCLGKWLFYYLYSRCGQAEILAREKGIAFADKRGQTHLYPRDMLTVSAPLPSIDEQQRLVAYLDSVQAQATALKRAQEDTDAELRRLEQAILDRAFRGEL